MKRKTKIFQIITISVFALLLILPTVQHYMNFIPVPVVGNENRKLTEMPTFNYSQIDSFPLLFENYYNDNFPLRAQYLAPTFTITTAFGKSPIEKTVLGKDMFMFDKQEIDRYTGKTAVSDSLLFKWVRDVKARNETLREMGIPLYIVIIPISSEIYPEYLPKYVVRARETAMDKLCTLMSERAPEVNFTYVKDLLLQKKDNGHLYYKYDVHWNHLAAYYTSEYLINTIKKDFPQIKPLDKDEFVFNVETNIRGCLIKPLVTTQNKEFFEEDPQYHIAYKDSSRTFTKGESRNYPIPKAIQHLRGFDYQEVFVSKDTTAPKAFVIRDSFWRYMTDFVATRFRETVCIWDAWTYWDNLKKIQQEKPDLVIMELYEQYFQNLAKFNELSQD